MLLSIVEDCIDGAVAQRLQAAHWTVSRKSSENEPRPALSIVNDEYCTLPSQLLPVHMDQNALGHLWNTGMNLGILVGGVDIICNTYNLSATYPPPPGSASGILQSMFLITLSIGILALRCFYLVPSGWWLSVHVRH